MRQAQLWARWISSRSDVAMQPRAPAFTKAKLTSHQRDMLTGLAACSIRASRPVPRKGSPNKADKARTVDRPPKPRPLKFQSRDWHVECEARAASNEHRQPMGARAHPRQRARRPQNLHNSGALSPRTNGSGMGVTRSRRALGRAPQCMRRCAVNWYVFAERAFARGACMCVAGPERARWAAAGSLARSARVAL